MTAIFLGIMGMSLTSCIIITAVILLRFLLKKAPKIFSYALWAVVFFRLLCPVTIEISTAVVTPVEIKTVDMTHYEYNAPSVPDIVERRGGTLTIYTSDSGSDPVYKKIGGVVDITAFVWLSGTTVMLCYGIISYIKLKARLKNVVSAQGHFLSGSIKNPFIMGIFKPKIYLPEKLDEDETRFILMHENIHIRRGDHIIKIIMFCALCLHWFNPLVWLSFKLCEKDMEMSCDESVAKNMSSEKKADYGQTLLNITSKRTAAFTACFGENSTKQRVKNVLSYKKPTLWIIIICTILAVAAVVILSTNQRQTVYPVASVSDEWTESGYFGSEFPYIIYADDDICAFTEGVSGFFIYSFEEEKLVFAAEMKETLHNAGVEHGGLPSWNGISFAAYNTDKDLKFLCSARTPDITRGFEFDLENNCIKEILDFETEDIAIVSVTSEKLPEGVTDALSYNCVYLENGYIYIRNRGISNDIEGSHLPMIELVRVKNGISESFSPFLE